MRELLIVLDPILRQKSEPVGIVDKAIIELAEYLESQLAPLEAGGLSAPQFGELVRVIAIRVDGMTTRSIINPEIVREKGEHWVVEGCRSLPGQQYKLKRPKVVKVRGLDIEGNSVTVKGSDFLAQILKHEIDHLDGILIDTIGKLVLS